VRACRKAGLRTAVASSADFVKVSAMVASRWLRSFATLFTSPLMQIHINMLKRSAVLGTFVQKCPVPDIQEVH